MQIDISKNRIFSVTGFGNSSAYLFSGEIFFCTFFFKEALPLSVRMRVKIFSQLMASVWDILGYF